MRSWSKSLYVVIKTETYDKKAGLSAFFILFRSRTYIISKINQKTANKISQRY